MPRLVDGKLRTVWQADCREKTPALIGDARAAVVLWPMGSPIAQSGSCEVLLWCHACTAAERAERGMTERIRRDLPRVAVIGFSSYEPGKQGAHTGDPPGLSAICVAEGGVGMATPPAAPPSGPQSDPDPDHFPAPDAEPQQPNLGLPEPDSEPPEQDGRQK